MHYTLKAKEIISIESDLVEKLETELQLQSFKDFLRYNNLCESIFVVQYFCLELMIVNEDFDLLGILRP
jgi:hypothetical protein